MLQYLALGVSALFSPSQEAMIYEASFTLPAQQEYVLEVEEKSLWDSVTLFSPDGKELPELEVLGPDGVWKEWHQEHYAHHIAPNSVLELLLFDESQDSLVVRSPEEISVVGHFFRAEDPSFWQVAANTYSPFETYGAKYKIEELSDDFNLPEPKFYSREDWGADERLRWAQVQRKLFNRSSSGLPSEIDDFPTKFKPKIIQDSYKGQSLSWPVAEMPELYKFVVHHTGEYVNPNTPRVKKDPFKTLRAIYYYHTITLGWGDIGYHYIIDKDGNIYEGRSGGPRAIGAHVAYHNAGSIGISLMGNFEVENPTQSQLESLSLLIADHASRFDIDPTGTSFYLNHNSKNVSGHKDVTAHGRGTACPGINLHRLLPSVRKKAKDYAAIILKGRPISHKTRNMLQKSKAAQNITRTSKFERQERKILTVHDVGRPVRYSRNQNGNISVQVTNHTDFTWPKGVVMKATNIPEGFRISSLKSTKALAPGERGTFTGRVRAETIPNGQYALTIEPSFLKNRLNEVSYKKSIFNHTVQISGDRRMLTRSMNTDRTTRRSAMSFRDLQASLIQKKNQTFGKEEKVLPKVSEDPNIKVKLSYFDQSYALVSSTKDLVVLGEGKELFRVRAGQRVRIVGQEDGNKSWLDVFDTKKQKYSRKDIRLVSEGVLKIHNYDRGINTKVAFNSFRSDLQFYPQKENLLVVNELPLEKYLYGLAEQTSSSPDEKRKAVLILARSYGLVYSGERRKFKTDLYDLEDSAASSQKYLGHDWERYHSSQKALVDSTRGLVLKYNGEPVIGPYFTQSGGASSSKWQSQYPWARGRQLPYDKGLEPKGHGVGLSGNSSRVLAEKGKNYKEILDYFFVGTSIGKGY